MKKLFLSLILFTQSLLIFAQISEKPILRIEPFGHSAMIRDVAFLNNGRTMVSVSDDKTIRIWDLRNSENTAVIRGEIGTGDLGKLYAVAVSKDGQYLAVGGDLKDNVIRVYHFPTRKLIGLLKGHTNIITDIQFDPKGKFLATSSGDKTIKTWDISSLSPQKLTTITTSNQTLSGHTDQVYSIAFSPDGSKLVSGSFDKSLRLWNRSGNSFSSVSKEMKEHKDKVYCVSFSPDGQYIASGGFDGKITLWKGNGEFYNILEDLGGKIFTLSFSNAVNKLVAMTDKGTVYEIPYGFKQGSFNYHDNVVTASGFLPTKTKDGHEMVASAGGENNFIFVWDAVTGTPLKAMRSKGLAVWSLGFKGDNTLAFGQTHKPSTDHNKGPLERSINLESLLVNLHVEDEASFTRATTQINGKKLSRINSYSIRTDGAVIKNDPLKDRTLRCYSFTPDEKIIVGSAGSLKLYSKSGTLEHEFEGHTGEVWSVAVSPNGMYLASSSNDQTIKIWNINSGELLATIYFTTDNEWIIWTPSGYYAASAGGEKYIGWHINRGSEQNADFHPVSTFRNKFLKPEVVVNTIREGGYTEQQPYAENIIKDELPPSIEWISPIEIENSGNEKTISIKAKITSKSPIVSYKILLNGRPLENARGLKKVDESTEYETIIEEEISLVQKESKIQILAINKTSKAVSDERIFRFLTQQQTTTPERDQNANAGTATVAVVDEADELDFDLDEYISEPSLYMLSVGVSEFKKTEYNLTYADDDAIAMAEVYEKQKGILFDQVYVKQLLNSDATRENILKSFEWLKEKAKPEDVVVIFFASHGLNFRGQFFIVPHDGNAADIFRTLVSWEDFSNVLGSLPSKVIVYVDACHSGALGNNINTSNTEALRNISSEEHGVVIMSASTGNESSLENSSWGHGAFTYSLLKGLEDEEANLNKDELIHLRELDYYIYNKVTEITGNEQHPTTQKPSTISSMQVLKVK